MPTQVSAPLTPAQSGVWFTEQMGDNRAAYHLPLSITFDGRLDVAALASAVAAVASRHPVLMAAVEVTEGMPRLALGAHRLVMAMTDLTAEPQDAIQAHVHDLVAKPFDLDGGGELARLGLLKLGDRRRQLILVAHHLVFDGSSKEIFVRELADAYRRALDGGQKDSLEPVVADAGYVQAVEAETSAGDDVLEEARAFWSTRWAEPGEVELPGARLPGQETEPGRTGLAIDASIDAALRGQVDKAALAIGVTRFEFLLAAFHALLHRYGNQTVTVAVEVGTRPAGAEVIGLFVNEMPVTTASGTAVTFREFALGIRSELRERYRVRAVPLPRVAAVRPGTTLSPVSLSYRRQVREPEFPGLSVATDWALFSGTLHSPLNLLMVDTQDGITVDLRFDPDLVPASSAALIREHYRILLASASSDPDARLADLPLLSQAERAWLLRSGTGAPSSSPTTLTELLRTAITSHLDRTAVVDVVGTRLAYRDLQAAVSRLANRLQRAGVGPGSVVGLCVDRSVDAVVGLLAVLEAGAAYLPLDPGYPRQHLELMIGDATPAAILLPARLWGVLADLDVLTIALDGATDQEPVAGPGARVRPQDPAYLIYTSGSTGRPKGVEVSHGSIANLLLAFRDQLGTGPDDVWLALTSLSFDVSALELFLPLIVGASAVVVPDRLTRDGPGLLQVIREMSVTHVQATPVSWELLLAAGLEGPSLTAICGGEALSAPLASRLASRVGRLLNAYGPTEATVWATLGEIRQQEPVTIGRPIAGMSAFVLDDHLQLAATGIEGDLHLAGVGLADHYHRRPGLTAAQFLPNPYPDAGSRLYRTGDRARLNPDGTITCLGRLDHQVKIRGHRIELGEIEANLLRHPAVQQAVVGVYEPSPDDRHLAGYFTVAADTSPPDPAQLRAYLGEVLPKHMVPSAFVLLDRLPLTPNGKIDRAALPRPTRAAAAGPSAAGEASADDVAAQIGAIWAEVLGLEEIGPQDDLFDLGGHSLTLTQIAARIRNRLGVDVPLYVLWDAPTVVGMAAAIRGDLQPLGDPA